MLTSETIIQIITRKRDEYYDYARQAQALPKTAKKLQLRGETLDEILDEIEQL